MCQPKQNSNFDSRFFLKSVTTPYSSDGIIHMIYSIVHNPKCTYDDPTKQTISVHNNISIKIQYHLSNFYTSSFFIIIISYFTFDIEHYID